MAQDTPVCGDCGATGRRMTRSVCSVCYMKRWRRRDTESLPRTGYAERTVKACPRCGETKSIRDFAKNNRSRDGASSYCRACIRARAKVKPRIGVPDVEGVEQTCTACKVSKPTSAFYFRPDSGRFRSTCTDCRSEKEKRARADQASSYHMKRRARLMASYGITLDDYYALLESQGGGCAICGREANPDARAMAVDHCHATGRVRGILCGPCNKAIGLMADNPELLARGAEYLKAR